MKPICDVLMVCPSLEGLAAYTARVEELKSDAVQELQQVLLFPLISRLKCNEMRYAFCLQTFILFIYID